jgi:oxaloacetate decarboxylase gamma subunit
MESSLTEMLVAGAKLMLIGMGIVYLFLALLVWIIGLTARLLQQYSPEPEVLPGLPGIGKQPESDEADVVAAIAAAVHRYRSR